MKKLIAVLGVLVVLGTIAGCSCPGPQQHVSYKGETH